MTSLPTGPQKNPAELLDIQVQVLNRIYQAQVKQHELLEKIRAQQEQLLPSSMGGGHQPTTGRLGHVKIVDFNMPFLALVGILVKMALASMPAALIIGSLWLVLMVGLFFALSVLGIGISALGIK